MFLVAQFLVHEQFYDLKLLENTFNIILIMYGKVVRS